MVLVVGMVFSLLASSDGAGFQNKQDSGFIPGNALNTLKFSSSVWLE
jgi:hypothetical protein